VGPIVEEVAQAGDNMQGKKASSRHRILLLQEQIGTADRGLAGNNAGASASAKFPLFSESPIGLSFFADPASFP